MGKRENKKTYVYLVGCEGTDFYKIGHSNSPANRLQELQVGCPYVLTLTFQSFPLVNFCSLEKALHRKFRKKRVRGEWFKLEKDDVNEVFDLFDFAEEAIKIS